MANLDPVALGAYKQAGGPSTGSDAHAAAKAAAKAAVDTLKKGQIPIETSWRVTGTLTLVDGDIYKMDNLRARLTDVQVDLPQGVGVPKVIPANTLLPKFSGKYVKVKLAGDGKSFVFSHSGTDEMAQRINLFFGGTYHRAD
jgi:hypothetical protein